jgi:hypothetical protein
MKVITHQALLRLHPTGIMIDLAALALIYFTPAISHLLRFPLYLAEPMRLMLILAMVHTRKANAYLLALTMPLFSFVISAHPVFPKMVLIGIELTLNVFLFYLLSSRIRNLFAAAFMSILLSKVVYYLLKFSLIHLAIIGSGLISTPVLAQVVTTLAFSLYLAIFVGKGYAGVPE